MTSERAIPRELIERAELACRHQVELGGDLPVLQREVVTRRHRCESTALFDAAHSAYWAYQRDALKRLECSPVLERITQLWAKARPSESAKAAFCWGNREQFLISRFYQAIQMHNPHLDPGHPPYGESAPWCDLRRPWMAVPATKRARVLERLNRIRDDLTELDAEIGDAAFGLGQCLNPAAMPTDINLRVGADSNTRQQLVGAQIELPAYMRIHHAIAALCNNLPPPFDRSKRPNSSSAQVVEAIELVADRFVFLTINARAEILHALIVDVLMVPAPSIRNITNTLNKQRRERPAYYLDLSPSCKTES